MRNVFVNERLGCSPAAGSYEAWNQSRRGITLTEPAEACLVTCLLYGMGANVAGPVTKNGLFSTSRYCSPAVKTSYRTSGL